jgi:MFS family permease
MSSFTAMFFLGVGSAIIGAASRNIGLSPYQIGLLLATQNIGFILSVITAGTLADSTDKARLMFAASLIIALTGLKYPEMSGTVMGIIKLGIPAGGIVVPLLLSLLVQATSFQAALVLFPVIGVAGFMLALTHRGQLAIVSKSDESMNT